MYSVVRCSTAPNYFLSDLHLHDAKVGCEGGVLASMYRTLECYFSFVVYDVHRRDARSRKLRTAMLILWPDCSEVSLSLRLSR